MGGANRQAALEAKAEKERREEEKAAFKAAQELESLRRAFKRIDKKGDGAIDVDELLAELQFLGHAMKASEAALTIWEVDDDAAASTGMSSVPCSSVCAMTRQATSS